MLLGSGVGGLGIRVRVERKMETTLQGLGFTE